MTPRPVPPLTRTSRPRAVDTTRYVALCPSSRPDRLTIGALLPTGKHVRSVRLDGHKATYRVVSTARGREVRVNGGKGLGVTDLVVRIR